MHLAKKNSGRSVLFASPANDLSLPISADYGTIAETSAELALSTLFESTEITT